MEATIYAFPKRIGYGQGGRDPASEYVALLPGRRGPRCTNVDVYLRRGSKKYSKVVEKFDAYFDIRKNVIFERARFNKRNQLEGETAEEYITALYGLVESCEYGTMKEELLRDRIVVGILDSNVSQKLQMNAKLTLEEAKKEIRQREAMREQSKQLQGGCHDSMGEVRRHRPQRSKGGAPYRGRPKPRDRPDHKCTRCGKAKHAPGDKCPASTAICHKCKRKGHYSSQCFSKTVASASQDGEPHSQDAAFLGPVETENKNTWTSTLQIAGKDIRFKLDTGAEVTAVSEATYRQLKRVRLQKAHRPLLGPAGQPLKVMGQFTKKVTHTKSKASSNEVVYVFRGLKNNLLGFPAIQNLRLIQRVDSVSMDVIKQRFAKVFEGLGKLGEEYTIKLKEGATPYSLYTPRKVPLPLRNRVKEELEKMEAMGVISKVDQPTPWCAGMVVVPKRSGAVRTYMC